MGTYELLTNTEQIIKSGHAALVLFAVKKVTGKPGFGRVVTGPLETGAVVLVRCVVVMLHPNPQQKLVE